MVLAPFGRSTKFQTCLSSMDFNSDLMASSHNSESGTTIASGYVKGSSLSNNNTLLELHILSDLRGAGATSTTGSLTSSVVMHHSPCLPRVVYLEPLCVA